MVKQGETFGFAGPSPRKHLVIILSDPAVDPQRIVTANFTSWRCDKDQSCVVEVGEHRFVKKRSCIDYRQDSLISLEDYKLALDRGGIIPHDRLSANLLARVLEGAAISPFIPLGSREILVKQGFIDNE